MSTAVFETAFEPDESVMVDGEVKGHVTQISIRGGSILRYEVEWFNNGQLQSGWFPASRLTPY